MESRGNGFFSFIGKFGETLKSPAKLLAKTTKIDEFCLQRQSRVHLWIRVPAIKKVGKKFKAVSVQGDCFYFVAAQNFQLKNKSALNQHAVRSSGGSKARRLLDITEGQVLNDASKQ